MKTQEQVNERIAWLKEIKASAERQGHFYIIRLVDTEIEALCWVIEGQGGECK